MAQSAERQDKRGGDNGQAPVSDLCVSVHPGSGVESRSATKITEERPFREYEREGKALSAIGKGCAKVKDKDLTPTPAHIGQRAPERQRCPMEAHCGG